MVFGGIMGIMYMWGFWFDNLVCLIGCDYACIMC